MRLALNKFDSLIVAGEQEVVEAINNCDVRAARAILRRNAPVLKELFVRAANTGPERTSLFELALVGAREVVDVEALEANWHLTDERWRAHSDTRGAQWGTHGLEGPKDAV